MVRLLVLLAWARRSVLTPSSRRKSLAEQLGAFVEMPGPTQPVNNSGAASYEVKSQNYGETVGLLSSGVWWGVTAAKWRKGESTAQIAGLVLLFPGRRLLGSNRRKGVMPDFVYAARWAQKAFVV